MRGDGGFKRGGEMILNERGEREGLFCQFYTNIRGCAK